MLAGWRDACLTNRSLSSMFPQVKLHARGQLSCHVIMPCDSVQAMIRMIIGQAMVGVTSGQAMVRLTSGQA